MVTGIIVGTGKAGTHLHFGAIKKAGAEILAYVDTNLDMARTAAKRYGVPHAFGSLDEALREVDVDFVDICSPTSSHAELARTALEHGCHAVVEKPLTTTLEEADRLNEVRRASNKEVCVVHNHKYFPGYVKGREVYQRGKVGRILHLYREMSFTHENVRMMEPGHWAHKLPGGRLMEANPHNLYLAYGFVGDMNLEYILPRKRSDRWPHALIDEFTALLSTDATIITIQMSLLATSEGYGRHGPGFMVVVGTKGTLIIDNRRCKFFEEAMTERFLERIPNLTDKARTVANNIRSDLSGLRDAQGGTINIGESSGHRWFFERFVGYLEGKIREPPTTWEEAYFVQRMNVEMGMAIEQMMRGTK